MKPTEQQPALSRLAAAFVAGLAFMAAGSVVALATSEAVVLHVVERSRLLALEAEHPALVATALVLLGTGAFGLTRLRAVGRRRVAARAAASAIALVALVVFAAPAIARAS
ncbi:MAG TPA: hypothetical protein VFF73_03285 [Planctomycetota bacterium]|nr:hypothetical protein [Planctomycetota bacterium]